MRKAAAATLAALLFLGTAAASEWVTVRATKVTEPGTDGYVLEIYIDGVMVDRYTDWMGAPTEVDYDYETLDGEIIQAYLVSQGGADYDLELRDGTLALISSSYNAPGSEPEYVGGENTGSGISEVAEAGELPVTVQVQKVVDAGSEGYTLDVYVDGVLVETDAAALATATYDYKYLLYETEVIEAFLVSAGAADYDIELSDEAGQVDLSVLVPADEPEYVAGEVVSSALVAYDDDHETDDDATEADARGYFTEGTDSPGEAYDDDYFAISVTAGLRRLDIALTFSHTSDDLDLYLYDSDGATELAFSESGDDNEAITFEVSAAGDYYLCVVPVTATGSAYTLRWDASIPDDSHEEDDTPAQADAKGLFAKDTDFSGVAYDDDYFAITVTTGLEQLDIALTFSHTSDDLDLYLYDSDGTTEVAFSESTDNNEAISVEVTAGDYYLCVVPVAASGNTYTLRWDASIPDDSHEEDDTPGEADGQISLSDATDFSGVAYDDDYFAITVTAGSEQLDIALTFSHTSDDLDLYLYASDGTTEVAFSESTDNNEAISVEVTAGDYYLCVVPVAASGNTYTLRWDASVPEDSHEEDDTPAEADIKGPFAEETDISGVAYDDDYFAISVLTGFEQLDIALTFSHAVDNLDLYLLDTDGSGILLLANSATDNESISYEVSAAGDYYLCVEPTGATGNTYTLRWDASRPGDDSHEEDDTPAEADVQGTFDEATNFSGVALDDDYFVINVQTGYEQVDATLTFSHATDDLDLYLLDTDGMTILELADTTTDDESISYEVAAAGVYYLCVEPVGATGNTYTLRWDASSTDDSHEEDDTPAEANAKGTFDEATNFSGVAYDDDYYLIRVPFGYEQVDVTLTFSHATDDLDLYLLDTDGMTILRLADSITDNESISYEVTAAGDYYLCVEPVGATGNTYTLRWDSSVPVVASSSATCAPSTATGTAGAAMASFALMIGAALALTRRRVNA